MVHEWMSLSNKYLFIFIMLKHSIKKVNSKFTGWKKIVAKCVSDNEIIHVIEYVKNS